MRNASEPDPIGDEPFLRSACSRNAAPTAGPPEFLRLLVVNSGTLHALAATLLESPRDALSVTSAEAEVLCSEKSFDIILLATGASTLGAIVLAARLRALERERSQRRRAAIIGCTGRDSQYLDCLVPGSGLSGALNRPWTLSTVHACLDRWRDGKYLPTLIECARLSS